MPDEELRRRLADLIVNALEVGAGKGESVIVEIFATFNVDFEALEAAHPVGSVDRARTLRQVAAERLAHAAPTASALVNELVRCGGRFVDMVQEVFGRLARQVTTTSGTSETFRLHRGGVDEEALTISPAFIEQVRRLELSLGAVQVGRTDEGAIRNFLLWDNGELYGTWPRGSDDGRRLPDAVLQLAWAASGTTDDSDDAVLAARAAAERLIAAAEQVLRAHILHLDLLPHGDLRETAGRLFLNQLSDWQWDDFEKELGRFRNLGVLGAIAVEGYVTDIDRTSTVGLDRELRPVVRSDSTHWGGTGMSQLAGFVALARLGLWASRGRRELEDRWARSTDRRSWMEWIATASDEAATWLTQDVFIPTGTVEANRVLEVVEEFLNLPLWRARELLYEVWVLCATFDAAEREGYEVELLGLAEGGGVWRLGVGPSADPIARLHGQDRPVSLDVWREPKRVARDGTVTPDVTVSTTGRLRRDLLVIEAKDRYGMPYGQLDGMRSGARRTRDMDTALGIARRYAAALRPVVTWVCNHCAFRDDPDPSINHGDPWTRIHLAAQFRPRNVPAAFGRSVRIALTPLADPPAPVKSRTLLTLVVDVTSSMRSVFDEIWTTISGDRWETFTEVRVILFSDHGPGEPFVVRKLGPFRSVAELAEAVTRSPRGHGGDLAEALEDAMQRCRELVDDVGPHSLLVLTDAPPHDSDDCPYSIDFGAEVGELLRAGCDLYVVTDWYPAGDPTWHSFQGAPNFHAGPLAEFHVLASTGPS
jgi:hypothetical protein